MSASPSARELSFASLILRLSLGQLMLVAGLGKFLRNDSVGAWVETMAKGFETTPLPLWVVIPYGYALPYVEIVLGLMLILGVLSRPAMLATAALLLSLTFGMTLQAQFATVANNTMYTALAAATFVLLRWNHFSLDHILGLDAKVEPLMTGNEPAR